MFMLKVQEYFFSNTKFNVMCCNTKLCRLRLHLHTAVFSLLSINHFICLVTLCFCFRPEERAVSSCGRRSSQSASPLRILGQPRTHRPKLLTLLNLNTTDLFSQPARSCANVTVNLSIPYIFSWVQPRVTTTYLRRCSCQAF